MAIINADNALEEFEINLAYERRLWLPFLSNPYLCSSSWSHRTEVLDLLTSDMQSAFLLSRLFIAVVAHSWVEQISLTHSNLSLIGHAGYPRSFGKLVYPTSIIVLRAQGAD